MRKRYWVAVIATLIGAAWTIVLAADIGNLSGQSCGDLSGEWHFVNNQTRSAGPGTLWAEWDSGDTCHVGPSQVSRNNQHFNCVASGELVSAETTLPGRLVLSDFSCETKEPPTCDPKDKKCDPPK